MIILEPSQSIKKATGINFNVLGDIVTLLMQNNHRKPVDFVAKVYKSKEKYCSYVESKDDKGHNFKIYLDQDSRQTRKFIFGSILHELRHCCQLNIFGFWPDTCKFNTYDEYYRSKEEYDARKIERLTKVVMKMYDAAMAANKQYKKFGLTRLG